MAMKQIFLLIIFQGFPLGCVCWRRRITHMTPALLGSCVEIPCTHRFHENIAMSGVVWFTGIYNPEEILNTKNLSSVSEKYRNRTSLIPGENNCTLRIDPVKKEDTTEYYSEAADYRIHDSNDYFSNPAILLHVRVAPKYVTVTITENGKIMEGSDVNLACTSISSPGVNTYEWYKGRNRTKLPNTGWKMVVKNVTRDEELYSCAAINDVGRGESALMEIPVLYEGSSHSFLASNCNIVLLSTIGMVCPLLLVLLLYFIWRDRCRKVTTSTAAESPDATYSDLIKKDIDNDYEDLTTRNFPHITLTGRH